jgi:hypothetical protein
MTESNVLDGDNIRHRLKKHLGFSPGTTLKEKFENLEKYGFDGIRKFRRGLPKCVEYLKNCMPKY